MSERFKKFSLSTSRLHKAMQKLKAKEMSEFDLKGEQTLLLYELYTHPEGELFANLAQALQLDAALISRNLKKLVDDGYCEKISGRGVYKATYRLSQKGRYIMEQADQILQEIEDFTRQGISDEQMAIYYAVNDQLIANLEARLKK